MLLHCDHWRHFESFLLKAFFLPSFLIYLNWLPACVRGSVEIKKSFMLTLEQVSDPRLKEGRGQDFLLVRGGKGKVSSSISMLWFVILTISSLLY